MPAPAHKPWLARLSSLVLAIAVLWAVTAPRAIAQSASSGSGSGPLVSELIAEADVRLPFGSALESHFARIVARSPAEAEAGAALIQAARAEVERGVNAYLRALRDSTDRATVEQAAAKLLVTARAAERRMLDDLRTVAGPGHDAELARFERQHRRVLLRIVRQNRIAFDLLGFFAKQEIHPGTTTPLTTALDRLDVDLDAALVRYASAALAQASFTQRPGESDVDARARAQKLGQATKAAGSQVERVQAEFLRKMASSLPDPLRDKLALELMTEDRRFAKLRAWPPDRRASAREASALPLSAAQRDALSAAISTADRELATLAGRYLQLRVDSVLAPGQQAPEFDKLLTAVTAAAAKFDADIRDLLTPEQIELLNAAPPTDAPSGRVNDAP